MVLADENVHFAIIGRLRQSGIDVYSISESRSGITDSEVIELSRNPPRIILTEDKDFGEWVFAHHAQGLSVVFLRYSIREAEEIAAIVTNLLTNRGKELINKFTTVTVQKIRTRAL